MKKVEVYYDYVSPWSYIAFKRMPEVFEDLDVEVEWKPVFLGGIMDATGNRPPAAVAAKFQYLLREVSRYMERYGFEMGMNPHFPMRTIDVLRGAVLARDEEVFEAYHDAMFHAVWRDAKNVGDLAVVVEILEEAGLDPSLIERTKDSEVKARLVEETEAAVDRGIFGAPTFFVGDEMFWGQDRLSWVVRELESS